MTSPSEGYPFRRDDGVTELRLTAVRGRRLTFAAWTVLLVALAVVGVVAVDPADRLKVLGIVAALAAGTAFTLFDTRCIGLLIDGSRLGWRASCRDRGGRGWVDLADVVEVQRDAHRPHGPKPMITYILYARDGGMTKRDALAIANMSAQAKRDLNDRVRQGYHPFVIRVSELGPERAAVVERVLEPLIRTKGRDTEWN